MKKVIYIQNRKTEMMKIYFFFFGVSLLGVASLVLSILSKDKRSYFFMLPIVGMGGFVYWFFHEFIKYGANIEINSENFIINDQIFDFDSLVQVDQCTNLHFVYFVFNKNQQTYRFVGFNRFTKREMLILNDKTQFVDMIKAFIKK